MGCSFCFGGVGWLMCYSRVLLARTCAAATRWHGMLHMRLHILNVHSAFSGNSSVEHAGVLCICEGFSSGFRVQGYQCSHQWPWPTTWQEQ